MKEKPLEFITRTFCMGPLILACLTGIEIVAFLFYKQYTFSLSLTSQMQIALTVPFVIIFIAGYLSFIATYLKNSVGKKVIKSGPYRLVRHPLYAADVITLPAIIAIWFNSIFFVISWVVMVLLLHFIVKMEEKYMEDKFGEEYRQYKKKVPAIFPYKGFVKF